VHVVHVAPRVPVVLELLEIHVLHERLQDLFRLRTLERQQLDLVTDVADGAPELILEA